MCADVEVCAAGLVVSEQSLEQASAYSDSSFCILLYLQIALDTSYWTVINHVFIWGSVATYFSILLAMHSNGVFRIFPHQFPFVGKELYHCEALGHTESSLSL